MVIYLLAFVGGVLTILSPCILPVLPFVSAQADQPYIGYERAKNFVSAEPIAQDSHKVYSTLPRLSLNQWTLGGSWRVSPESAVLQAAPGKVVFRFHARDLHLVLGSAKAGDFLVEFKHRKPASGRRHAIDCARAIGIASQAILRGAL